MNQINFFELLKQFVPVGFQLSASNFTYYLKTLTPKMYRMQYVDINVKADGIEFFINEPKTTHQQFLRWSEITRVVLDGFPKPTFSESMQEQLKMAF
jgi:hypothetical protein